MVLPLVEVRVDVVAEPAADEDEDEDEAPGMINSCPSLIRRGSEMLFALIRSLTETPYLAAMPPGVSPDCTVWRVPLPAGALVRETAGAEAPVVCSPRSGTTSL